MKAPAWFWSLGLPVALASLYPVAVFVVSDEGRQWFWSEDGPVEWLTAVVFFAAGLVALRLFWRTRGKVRPAWSMLYVLFALGGILMAGEELSWGQHALGFETPEVVAEHNVQGEMNAHNLFGDDPSRLLRRVAQIGLPVLCVIVPIVVMGFDRRKREAYTPGHWPYYLMPKLELAPALVLAVLFDRVFEKFDNWGFSERWYDGPGELAELLWAAAVLIWVLTVWYRLTEDEVAGSRA